MFAYQREVLNKFYQLNPVLNQVILEVGGSEPLSIPHDLAQQGASKIVTVSINKSFKSRQVSSKILALQTNASSMNFSDCYFDSVISVATLEHISNLASVLSELYRVTKPNGIVFMHGAPLWSSKVGSHYNFSVQGLTYHYNKNPILADWEHLYSDKNKIQDRLKSKYPDAVIDSLIYDVYNNPHINRMFPSEIIKIIKDSPFNILNIELTKWNDNISNEMIDRIKHNNNQFDQDFDQLIIHLRK